MSRRRMDAAVVLTVAIGVLAGVPAAASAALTVTYAPATGAKVQGDVASDTASVSLVNDVFIRVSPASGTVISPGSGCTADGSAARCSANNTSKLVTANLGAGDDSLTAFSYPGDLFLFGEDGKDTLTGGDGPDLLDGGSGADTLSGRGGNDQVKGGPANDVLIGDGGGVDALLGEGDDDVFKAGSVGGSFGPGSNDQFDGGAGVDVADYSRILGASFLRVTVGGPSPISTAANAIDHLDNVETLIGGTSGDLFEFRNAGRGIPSGTRTIIGNEGDDTLRVFGTLRTSLDGGLGSDSITGGLGPDTIFSREGEKDTITCGSDLDTLKPDLKDVPVSDDCEILDQGDRREGPNVRLPNRFAAVNAAGRFAVRVVCPRGLRIGCHGAVSARLDRKGTRFGAAMPYSLSAGKATTVVVKLAAGQVAGARARGARLRVRSIERGVHGPKTTQRVVPARKL